MSKLIELELSYNKLAKIDCCFKGLEKFEYLSLSTNIIIDINPNAFRGLFNLKQLILDENKFNKFNSLFNSLFFIDLRNLQELNLGFREI